MRIMEVLQKRLRYLEPSRFSGARELSAPQPERLVDERDQTNHIPFGQPPHLAFPDHVHRFVALNCS